MKRLIVFALIGSIALISCKKENPVEEPTVPKETVLDYFPLTIGNYWVYESFHCDSNEITCESNSIDTNWVTKDTLINGNTFYKIEGRRVFWKDPVFFRDSGDYIVDEKGKVVFTHLNTQDVFNYETVLNPANDTIFYWYFKLKNKFEDVSVQAGEFECLNFQGSLFRIYDDFETEHFLRNNYSKNVGLVEQKSLFATSLHVVKRELVGYHIIAGDVITP